MRLYSQYRKSPKLIQWLNIVPTQAEQLSQVAEAVRLSYDIDTATSYELDILGRIVGQPRDFESAIDIASLSLGSYQARLGGLNSQLKPYSQSVTQSVSDSIYRVLIRSKIMKNTSNATIDDVLASIEFITSVVPAGITEGDMAFGINFGDVLTGVERFLIDNFDVIPKPQGVRFLGYTEEPNVTRLGRNQLQNPLAVQGAPSYMGSGLTMGSNSSMTELNYVRSSARTTQLTGAF